MGSPPGEKLKFLAQLPGLSRVQFRRFSSHFFFGVFLHNLRLTLFRNPKGIDGGGLFGAAGAQLNVRGNEVAAIFEAARRG